MLHIVLQTAIEHNAMSNVSFSYLFSGKLLFYSSWISLTTGAYVTGGLLQGSLLAFLILQTLNYSVLSVLFGHDFEMMSVL